MHAKTEKIGTKGILPMLQRDFPRYTTMWTNHLRASEGVVDAFDLPGVGVEGDSSRDPAMPLLPCSLENVVGEGWASCGGTFSSTGADPNLL